tara:strand:- start:160 stop:486 length:327 start_codon:yes stop_codon:yes gene_type:complete
MARNPRAEAAEMMVEVEEPMPEMDMADMADMDMAEMDDMEMPAPMQLLTSDDVEVLTSMASDRGMSDDDASMVVEIVEEFLGGGGMEMEMADMEVDEDAMPPLDLDEA